MYIFLLFMSYYFILVCIFWCLYSNSNGSVQFTMSEKLAGILFALAAKHIPSFDAPFEQFAADLKKEAEARFQQKNNPTNL